MQTEIIILRDTGIIMDLTAALRKPIASADEISEAMDALEQSPVSVEQAIRRIQIENEFDKAFESLADTIASKIAEMPAKDRQYPDVLAIDPVALYKAIYCADLKALILKSVFINSKNEIVTTDFGPEDDAEDGWLFLAYSTEADSTYWNVYHDGENWRVVDGMTEVVDTAETEHEAVALAIDHFGLDDDLKLEMYQLVNNAILADRLRRANIIDC